MGIYKPSLSQFLKHSREWKWISFSTLFFFLILESTTSHTSTAKSPTVRYNTFYAIGIVILFYYYFFTWPAAPQPLNSYSPFHKQTAVYFWICPGVTHVSTNTTKCDVVTCYFPSWHFYEEHLNAPLNKWPAHSGIPSAANYFVT